MKAIEQYYPLVLFIMPCRVVITCEFVDEILKCDHLNEAIEQCFPVVLFMVLYKIAVKYASVDEVLHCACIQMTATEKYFPDAIQGGSNFLVCG